MLSPTSVPVQVKRRVGEQLAGAGLDIKWSTGESVFLSSEFLRTHCPCASCLEARGSSAHSKPLKPAQRSLRVLKASAVQETDLKEVWPIGNYALGIRWGDRHDSGIYTFEILRELADLAPKS